MPLQGMNVDNIRQISRDLTGQAGLLTNLSLRVDALVERTRSQWRGPDASRFESSWRDVHKAKVAQLVGDLEGLARSLWNNADDQDRASGNADLYRNPVQEDGAQGAYRDFSGDIGISESDIKPDDIRQGGLGDCYLIAALRSEALRDPAFLADHLHHNADGTYTVTLFDAEHHPVDVTVDASAPTGSAGGTTGSPNWVTLYEKAYAEYLGGMYSDIEGGQPHANGLWAIQTITGRQGEYIEDPSLQEIKSQLMSGPVTASTKSDLSDHFNWFWERPDTETLLCPNHAYSVEKVELHWNPADSRNEEMVHLLNPWGHSSNGNAADLWVTQKEFNDYFYGTFSTQSGVMRY